MSNLYDRYQQGFHQQVYDELLAMQDHIYEPHIYEEALAVTKAMMQKVRFNIEQIILRLHKMGYLFGNGGFWENFSLEEKLQAERDSPVFQPPTLETLKHVAALEKLAGFLPLSLKYWYEEVGCVNLIGLFPSHNRGYGPVLDPLYVESVEMVLQVVTNFVKIGGWEEEPLLLLAPDCYHKYGYSGAGSYNIALPCKAIDAPFLNEPHNTTFVNYLRICCQWGGFPGLEKECRLSHKELEYLTKDLLPF